MENASLPSQSDKASGSGTQAFSSSRDNRIISLTREEFSRELQANNLSLRRQRQEDCKLEFTWGTWSCPEGREGRVGCADNLVSKVRIMKA